VDLQQHRRLLLWPNSSRIRSDDIAFFVRSKLEIVYVVIFYNLLWRWVAMCGVGRGRAEPTPVPVQQAVLRDLSALISLPAVNSVFHVITTLLLVSKIRLYLYFKNTSASVGLLRMLSGPSTRAFTPGPNWGTFIPAFIASGSFFFKILNPC